MAASARASIHALRAIVAMNDRRRFRRVPAALHGRMMDRRGREFGCRTLNVSAAGALLTLDSPRPPEGDLVLYLDKIGRVTAQPVRPGTSEGVAAVRFTVGAAKRERIVEDLTVAINAPDLAPDEERRALRFAGLGPAMVTPDVGESFPATLLDISIVGALVSAPERQAPPLGSWVRIGQTWGRVARMIEGGFAVDFQPRPNPRQP